MGAKKSKASEDGGGETNAATLLREAGKTLMPVLISAGSLLGFVAFAGGVILWTRFQAVGVPPEQAVDAVPDGELIATGSVLLLLFGFFGALALVSAFLVDRSARLTPGMARFLLILFALEGAVAIILVEGHTFWPTVVDLLLFLPPVAGAAWVTMLGEFSELKDDLRARDREKRPPDRNRGFLRPDRIRQSEKEVRQSEEETKRSEKEAEQRQRRAARWALAPLTIVGFTTLAGVALLVFDGSDTVFISVLGSLLALLALAISLLVCWDRGVNEEAAGKPKAKAADKQKKKQAKEKVQGEADAARKRAKKADEPPPPDSPIRPRMYKPRPRRFRLKTGGEFVAAILLGVAVVLPAIRLDKTWLLVALAAAVVITVAVRRVAWLANERLMWFGIALFLSVPLFGTVMTMARNLDEPRVQPVAIIRSTDGPSEAIHGLYVTETDDRVYFANVATEGCTKDLEPDSGRLLWVPRKEVVAMSIGPAQDVKSAGSAALEMAYALTPAVETPTAGSFTLTTAERRFEAPEPALAHEVDGQRLETAGPAVRPDFGAGISLDPEVATPGGEVALRMSEPNEHRGVRGFGAKPEGRTLRLDGIPLTLIKEEAEAISQAEYVKTKQGLVVGLDKEGLYGRETDAEEPRPLSDVDRPNGERFLKLEAGETPYVGRGGVEGYSKYIRMAGGGVRDGTRVVVDDEGSSVPLRQVLLSQAWSKDEIRFRVPDNAASGVVTVECEQLAGQPLLRVARAPKARLSVRMSTGSRRILLDSSLSGDPDARKDKDGQATTRLTRKWTIAGRHMGNRKTASIELRPRLAPYSARLTVTDKDGQSDSIRVRLFRLPTSLFDFDKDEPRDRMELRKLKKSVRETIEAHRRTSPLFF